MPSWSTVPPTGPGTRTTSDMPADIDETGDPTGVGVGPNPETHTAGAPEEPSPLTSGDHASIPTSAHTPPATTPRRRVLNRWIRGTWCAGVLVLTLSAVVWDSEDPSPVLVLWGHVVTGAHRALVVGAAVLVLWAVSLLLVLIRLGEPFEETPVLVRRILRRTIRTLTTLATLAVLPLIGLAIFVASLSLPLAAHHMLPDGPTGCRLYAVVDDAYRGTVTHFYLLAPGRVRTGGMSTAWSTGDKGPADPVVSLQWSLEWEGRTATLTPPSSLGGTPISTAVCPSS